MHGLVGPVAPERTLSRGDYKGETEMPLGGFRLYYVILEKPAEADGEYFEHLLS